MSIHPVGPAQFFRAVGQSIRKSGGRCYSATAKRWRNTRSDETALPVLDAATGRFLIRLGVLDAGDDLAGRRAAFESLLRGGARALGEAPGVLAAHLHAFAAGEEGWPEPPFCGDVPRCGACPLCEGCRFLTAGAKVERLSSGALSRRLAADGAAQEVEHGVAELLALLLLGERTGAGAVARVQALLQEAGGLRELMGRARGPGEASALAPAARARLGALRELIGHWSRERRPRGRACNSAAEFHEHYHLRMRELKQECFCVACLDQKNRMLADEQVSTGSLTEALVHPREVLSVAIRNRAAAIAVIHNHPSGDPAPSRADRQLTQRLKEAADLVGIRMLDHVIVGDGRYFSFAESGAL